MIDPASHGPGCQTAATRSMGPRSGSAATTSMAATNACRTRRRRAAAAVAGPSGPSLSPCGRATRRDPVRRTDRRPTRPRALSAPSRGPLPRSARAASLPAKTGPGPQDTQPNPGLRNDPRKVPPCPFHIKMANAVARELAFATEVRAEPCLFSGHNWRIPQEERQRVDQRYKRE